MASTIDRPQSQQKRPWEAKGTRTFDIMNRVPATNDLVVRNSLPQDRANPGYNNTSEDDSSQGYDPSAVPVHIRANQNKANGRSKQNNGAVVERGNGPGQLRISSHGNEAHDNGRQNNGYQTITSDIIQGAANTYLLLTASFLVVLFFILFQLYLRK